MHYIIIGFIAVVIVVVIGKFVLFEPRVNSIIWLLYFIYILKTALQARGGSLGFRLILIGIAIIVLIDCIRDIIIAKDYYEDIEIRIDKLYKIKSLTSIFTSGLA